MTFAFQTWEWIANGVVFEEPEPEEKPAPVCCPECWRSEPISPEKAWDAVKALCGG